MVSRRLGPRPDPLLDCAAHSGPVIAGASQRKALGQPRRTDRARASGKLPRVEQLAGVHPGEVARVVRPGLRFDRHCHTRGRDHDRVDISLALPAQRVPEPPPLTQRPPRARGRIRPRSRSPWAVPSLDRATGARRPGPGRTIGPRFDPFFPVAGGRGFFAACPQSCPQSPLFALSEVPICREKASTATGIRTIGFAGGSAELRQGLATATSR